MNNCVHDHSIIDNSKDNSVWKRAGICPTNVLMTVTNLVLKGILMKTIYRVPNIKKEPGT
ncbi:MAG TPA: hypothetical protein VF088_05605 [Pyrinomonadaceae bacterium]